MDQSLVFNFSGGLDTKTDPKQVQAGKFLKLQNTVFNKGGLLQKRNGFGELSLLPNSNSTYLTTFNDNLTAISNSILAFSEGNKQWVSKGNIQPLSLDTQALIRSNTNQSQADIAISNGLICTVYTDQTPTSLSTPRYMYVIADSVTGQNIIEPTPIPPSGGGTVMGSPRVFVLGRYFIILFTNDISGTYHLQYVAISTLNPSMVTPATDVANNYTPFPTLSYDGVVFNNSLYIAYNTTNGGQSIKVTFLSESLLLAPAVTFAGRKATMMSMTVDQTVNNPVVYAAFYDLSSTNGYVLGVNAGLLTILAPTLVIAGTTALNITSTAQAGACDVYYEVANNYSYDSSIPSHFIDHVSVTSGGSVGSTTTIIRSVGLASKARLVNSKSYFLVAYQSDLQPTYFLIDGTDSIQTAPIIVGKLAYQNGGGYLTTGLPNLLVAGQSMSVPYLFKDLITAVNKNTNVPSGTQVDGIYSQTGINYATFTLGTQEFDTAEIGSALQTTGGFLWMYDGYLPVEQNFFVYPDNVEVTSATTGGFLAAQVYFYQVIYEWTDNQGMAHRGAPSVPVEMDISASMTATNANTVNLPSLRLTYKTNNPVKAVIFRWSTAQQEYFQVTSITLPVINTLSSDSLSFVDTLSDASILGNSLIYTTGGVVEDVNAPASNILALWNTRLFLVDAEDKNLIWYSKPVIENTPVEMSDLFTIFLAPTIGASGSTGPITAMAAMDTYLIPFKNDAIYFISGTGPDITGANNQFTDPVFITSVVGCSNQQSIVLTPKGLMFQSDKGIWLLDRSLQTSYIGAPVEDFTLGVNVESAVVVPETNQVRFTLDSGITLMYDYYYDQWSAFIGIPGLSSCIYNQLHTYLDKFGRVFQETPGEYLDGSDPVLIGLTTGWLNLAGFTGYQRIKEFSLLGSYITPHQLAVQVAYNFGNPIQQSIITPKNTTGVYGSDSLYGQTSPYGGPGNLEQWRVHTRVQKCQVFQVSILEQLNPQFQNMAGAGFNLSGINCVIDVKKTHRPFKGANSVG